MADYILRMNFEGAKDEYILHNVAIDSGDNWTWQSETMLWKDDERTGLPKTGRNSGGGIKSLHKVYDVERIV